MPLDRGSGREGKEGFSGTAHSVSDGPREQPWVREQSTQNGAPFTSRAVQQGVCSLLRIVEPTNMASTAKPCKCVVSKSYHLTGGFSSGGCSEPKTRMSIEWEALAWCPVHAGHRLYLEPALIREASSLSPQGRLNTLLTLFPARLCFSLLIYRL